MGDSSAINKAAEHGNATSAATSHTASHHDWVWVGGKVLEKEQDPKDAQPGRHKEDGEIFSVIPPNNS